MRTRRRCADRRLHYRAHDDPVQVARAPCPPQRSTYRPMRNRGFIDPCCHLALRSPSRSRRRSAKPSTGPHGLLLASPLFRTARHLSLAAARHAPVAAHRAQATRTLGAGTRMSAGKEGAGGSNGVSIHPFPETAAGVPDGRSRACLEIATPISPISFAHSPVALPPVQPLVPPLRDNLTLNIHHVLYNVSPETVRTRLAARSVISLSQF